MGQKKYSDSKSFRPTESYSWSIGKMSRKGNVLALTNTFFLRPQACESLASVQTRESVEKNLSKRCGLVGE